MKPDFELCCAQSEGCERDFVPLALPLGYLSDKKEQGVFANGVALAGWGVIGEAQLSALD